MTGCPRRRRTSELPLNNTHTSGSSLTCSLLATGIALTLQVCCIGIVYGPHAQHLV